MFNVSIRVKDYGFHSHGGVAHCPDCSVVAAVVAFRVGVICAGVGLMRVLGVYSSPLVFDFFTINVGLNVCC